VKDLLGYIPFRIAAAIFSVFPERWVRGLGEWAGSLAAGRRKGKYPLLRSHMARVLGSDATDTDLDAAVRDMYRSYGRYWAETFWFRPRRRDFILGHAERVHFEPVFSSIASGNGRIFALPHVGNWEVAGLIADDIGSPVVAVAEHLPNQRITDWFLDVRSHFGIEIILTSDPNRTRKLITLLKDGRAIALVADRDVTGRGVDVEFFGERTTMPAGAIALADLTGADLLPVGAYFRHGRGYRIVVHDPIVIPDLPTREERVAAGVQEFAGVLEDIIREEPSQWHLFQPNWPSDARFEPSGEP
jgi:lauroyl/myristoyl acyltransferase